MDVRQMFATLIRKKQPPAEASNPGQPATWVGKFPHVPSPESTMSIRYVSARWTCHQLYREDLPRIATDLLGAGFDSPALRRLAGEINAPGSDNEERLFAQVHRDFGLSYPMPLETAQLLLTRQLAREVIAGKHDIWWAESDLKKIWNWDRSRNDVAAVLHLFDEVFWDDEEQDYVPAVTPELLDAFARLANLSDEQILS